MHASIHVRDITDPTDDSSACNRLAGLRFDGNTCVYIYIYDLPMSALVNQACDLDKDSSSRKLRGVSAHVVQKKN